MLKSTIWYPIVFVFIWLNIVFTVCSTILFCKAYVLCPALFAEWRLLWEENKHYDSYIQLSLLPLEARSASNQGFSYLIFFSIEVLANKVHSLIYRVSHQYGNTFKLNFLFLKTTYVKKKALFWKGANCFGGLTLFFWNSI